MKKYLVFALAILFISPFEGRSQRLKNRWKGMRGELNFGIGASNFLGELGGADQIGTHFFKDYEWSETHPAIQVGYRYKLSREVAFNTHITYGHVSGDDKTTKEFYRNYRNLSFKSHILEWNLNAEFAFIKDQVGHRYRLRGVRGQRGYEMMAYGFVGIGLFHFDPKAKLYGEGDAVWVKLHPLHTEGQTLLETRKKYHRLQFCIPVGIGFKYTISRRWGIGLEYGIRKTFTDYIDDASRTYVSESILAKQEGQVSLSNGEVQSVGALAVILADRSDPPLYPQITSPGAQRGDPRYTDSYMFGMVTLNYKLKTGRVVYPLF